MTGTLAVPLLKKNCRCNRRRQLKKMPRLRARDQSREFCRLLSGPMQFARATLDWQSDICVGLLLGLRWLLLGLWQA